jgi:hypothetical protein
MILSTSYYSTIEVRFYKNFRGERVYFLWGICLHIFITNYIFYNLKLYFNIYIFLLANIILTIEDISQFKYLNSTNILKLNHNFFM